MFNVLADRLWATAIQAEKTTVSRDKIVVRIQGLLIHRYPTFHQPVLQRAAIVLSPPPVALRVGCHPWRRPWQTTRTRHRGKAAWVLIVVAGCRVRGSGGCAPAAGVRIVI